MLGVSWGKERPGVAREEGLVVGEDLGEFELGGWPLLWVRGKVRAGHFWAVLEESRAEEQCLLYPPTAVNCCGLSRLLPRKPQVFLVRNPCLSLCSEPSMGPRFSVHHGACARCPL